MKINTPETWRDIPGHQGYQASSLGRIRSLDRKQKNMSRWGTLVERVLAGKILKHWINKKGYHYVNLGAGQNNRKEVHYWIASTFMGERPTGFEINHKDGNKNNNAPDNLEFVTRGENIRHAFANKLNHSGSKHGISKLNESQVVEIRQALKGKRKRMRPYYSEIASTYRVDRKTIEAIAKNKTWTVA
jgi:hypothetical protein